MSWSRSTVKGPRAEETTSSAMVLILLSTPLYRLSASVKYRKRLNVERMTARITTYHEVSLNFMLLNHCIFVAPEYIPHPSDGMNKLLRGVHIYLAAQVVDIDIDDVGHGVKVVVPHVFRNHGPRHHPIGMAHEIFEQGIFFGREIDLLAASAHRMGDGVQDQIS